MRVNFTVNGRPQEADDVWEGESLLYVLRERMGLPGSKNACEQGECGSCTVRLDGVPVCACLVAMRPGRGPRGRHRRGAGRLRQAPPGHPPRRRLRLRHLRHQPGRGQALAVQAHRRPGRPRPPRSPRSSRRSSTPEPSSAASAPPACWSPPTNCWRTARPRPTRTSARRSPATCAAARVTRRSSTRSASRPPARKRRSSHDDAPRSHDAQGPERTCRNPHQDHPGFAHQGRHRRVHAPPRRHPEGHRRVRVLLRHVARGHAVGPDAALHRRARRDRLHRHLRGPGDARRLRRADLRRPARRDEELRPGDPGHPGSRPRQGPPPR